MGRRVRMVSSIETQKLGKSFANIANHRTICAVDKLEYIGPGKLGRSVLRPYMNWIDGLFVAKGDDRIDPGGAPGWEVGCRSRDGN
jgi:hypothetical protein